MIATLDRFVSEFPVAKILSFANCLAGCVSPRLMGSQKSVAKVNLFARIFATLSKRTSGMKIGYARVSTLEQNLDLQLQALKKAGCRRIFQEKISASTRNRPEFQRMFDQIPTATSWLSGNLIAWPAPPAIYLRRWKRFNKPAASSSRYPSHGLIRPRMLER
jgi:hypothetical protein